VRAAQARQETLLFGRRRSPRHRGRIRPAGRALLRRLSVALARGPISPPCGAGRSPTASPAARGRHGKPP